jgi:hypothetical protein
MSPQVGPEYNLAGTTTTYTVAFRLDLDLEQDQNNGYGCIPNLDANASLQLKVDVNAITASYTGTGLSVATVQMYVDQHYWAPVGSTLGGMPVQTQPDGFGDYIETRYETQPVSASTENLVSLTNRGGLVKGIIAVSRAAGVRTAFTAGSNVGLLLDNNPIDEGIILASYQDKLRRIYGYIGADIGTSYALSRRGRSPVSTTVFSSGPSGLCPVAAIRGLPRAWVPCCRRASPRVRRPRPWSSSPSLPR